MTTIYKFPVPMQQLFQQELPKGATVLSVQEQVNAAQMWVMLDPDEETEVRHFEVYGTGFEMRTLTPTEKREYIGTFQMDGGQLVFHLFELKEYK